MNIGKSLALVMADKGWSRADVAKRIGRDDQTISRIKGMKVVHGDMIVLLAAAAGMKASEFVALGEK